MKKAYKKPLIAVAVLASLIAAALVAGIFIKQIKDPNEALRKHASEVREGELYEAQCEYDADRIRKKSGIAVFSFTAPESAEYTFRTEYNDTEVNALIDMYVVDETLSEHLSVSDHDEGAGSSAPGSIEGSAFLSKGQLYYIAITAFPEDTETNEITVPFSFSVSREEDADEPPELTAGSKVALNVKKDQETCAVFAPDETSYYKFDTVIVSKDASAGFSSVAGITEGEGEDVPVTDGVCYLEAGAKCYIWVSVEETTKSGSEVELRCRKLGSASEHGECSIYINENTVIEYTADADGPMMISSSSDGDPDCTVYDSDGFMLRTDDDSGETVSGNGHDFALGLNMKKGQIYRIYVGGDYTQCTVDIRNYKGDGTAPDPVDEQTEEEDPAEEDQQTEGDI